MENIGGEHQNKRESFLLLAFFAMNEMLRSQFETFTRGKYRAPPRPVNHRRIEVISHQA